MPVNIHALVFQKKDDNTIILTCGLIQRDPELVANMLTALRNLSEEVLGAKEEIEMTFHHFGTYFVFLLAQKDFYVSVFTDAIELERIGVIGEILRFAFRVSDIFKKIIWNNLSEEQKELGLISEEAISDFEKAIVKIVATHEWSDKVHFSEHFITSASGFTVLKVLYGTILSRLQRVLGPNLTILLFDKAKEQNEGHDISGVLRIEKNKEIKPILIVNENSSMGDVLYYLAKIYNHVIKKIRRYFISNALEDIDVISLKERDYR